MKFETQFLANEIYCKILPVKQLACYHPVLKVAVSLFIAAKYHELHALKIEQILRKLLLFNVKKDVILTLESEVLILLNFDLSSPSPLDFIDLLVAKF